MPGMFSHIIAARHMGACLSGLAPTHFELVGRKPVGKYQGLFALVEVHEAAISALANPFHVIAWTETQSSLEHA